jgi:hypothetical protein
MNERPESSALPTDLPAGRVEQIALLRRLDAEVVAAAAEFGLRVERAAGSWVSYRAAQRAIVVAPDQELDPDDCLLQIVLHELCHWMVQGPAAVAYDDWGLDNQTADDEACEHAALMLQRTLLAPRALVDVLEPTTEFRAYYRELGFDPPTCAASTAASAGLDRWRAHSARSSMENVLQRAVLLLDALHG